MDEIKAMLAASDAPDPIRVQALATAIEIGAKIAYQSTSMQAGGQFLELLMQLLKVLLPLLLDLLRPRT